MTSTTFSMSTDGEQKKKPKHDWKNKKNPKQKKLKNSHEHDVFIFCVRTFNTRLKTP
jgi:hypothetical protein